MASMWWVRGIERPEVLLLAVLALVGLYVVFRKNRALNRIVGISRFFLIALLVLAAAGPYTVSMQQVSEEPELVVLHDRSRSSELLSDFDLNLDNVQVRQKVIASGNSSDLQNGILRNLQPNTNYLVVSDFQSTTSLQGLPDRFQPQNATLNALDLDADEESAVTVEGPSSTVPGAQNRFSVHVSSTADSPPQPEVLLDGDTVDLEEDGNTTWTFTETFDETGSHTLEARIDAEDRFPANNRYYRAVEVVEKPSVLIIGDEGPLGQRMGEFYDVTYRGSVPSDLSEYYTVLLKRQVGGLIDYVSEGNGVVQIGELNRPEEILPVEPVPSGEQNQGAKIALAIDISQSAEEEVAQSKKIAYSLIELLPFNNRVGAVAYNRDAYRISNPEPLAFNRDELKQKIARLETSGPSFHHRGIQGAAEILNGTGNIIHITDGRIGGLGSNRNVPKKTRDAAANLDVRLIVVSMGEDANTDFLQQLADLGGGTLLDGNNANKLQFMFDSGGVSGSTQRLTVINPRHFITRNMEVDLGVTLLDSVQTRRGADLLLSTTSGKPFLSAWTYGLGRVASIPADTANIGHILENEPAILTRTVSWAVGDPKRKQDRWISIESSHRPEKTEIQASYSIEGLKRQGDGLYTGEVQPDGPGFHEFQDKIYSYNYNPEIQEVGYSDSMERIVRRTGGEVYSPDELDELEDDLETFSEKQVPKKQSVAHYLLLAALILFLGEVGYRKLNGFK